MNTTVEINGINFELVATSALTAGHGHKKITVTLAFEGKRKDFSRTIDDMQAYDEAMDIEDYNEKNEAFFEIISYRIEDDVIEWHNEITAFYYIEGVRDNRIIGIIDTDGNLCTRIDRMDIQSYMGFETEEDAEEYIENVLKASAEKEDETGFKYSVERTN